MKGIKQITLRKYKIVKISGKYYINLTNCNQFIIVNGEKYYEIKKPRLKKLGMKIEKKSTKVKQEINVL